MNPIPSTYEVVLVGLKRTLDVCQVKPGINIAVLTPQQAAENRLGDVRGVIIIQVEPGSIAEDAGLHRNDVIEMVNRQMVASNEQFQRALYRIKSGDPVVLQIVTRSRQYGLTRRFISFTKP